MRHRVALTALVSATVVVLVGCGASKRTETTLTRTIRGSTVTCTSCSHQLTARQVERAFWRAGVPFTGEQDLTDPYLRSSRPQSVPLPHRAQPFAKHLTAFLVGTDPVTFKSEIAYVFDSPADAEAAVRADPLASWMSSNNRVTDARVENVLILATTRPRRVRNAISSLIQQSGSGA